MAEVHFENLEGKELGEASLFGIGGYVIVLVPVGIVILFNIGVVVFLSYILLRARRWQLKVSEAIASHKHKSQFTRIYVIIISILGLTWILLFVVYWDGVVTSDAVYIIHNILNPTYSTHLNPLSCALHSLGQRRFSECIYLFASVNQTIWMRPRRRPLQEINSKIGNFYRFSSPTSNWQSRYQSFSLDGRIAWTQT